MGAAVVTQPNTEYTQSIGDCWKKLPKKKKKSENNMHYCNLIINSVTEIFSKYDLHNIFKIFVDGKKLLSEILI